MIGAIADVAAFLLEHLDLIDELVKAIDGGTPKDAIKAAIKAAMIATSDAAMREELGAK